MQSFREAGFFAQMEKRKALCNKNEGFFSFVKTENEYIRWYDREDHTIFDVCADDHCQRYQGITKARQAQSPKLSAPHAANCSCTVKAFAMPVSPNVAEE